jgi:hypothetical protein
MDLYIRLILRAHVQDFAKAIILIYGFFPKRGLLHTNTENLAVAWAGDLFSEEEAAIRFQETVAPVTQFLIKVCSRHAPKYQSPSVFDPEDDLAGPTDLASMFRYPTSS